MSGEREPKPGNSDAPKRIRHTDDEVCLLCEQKIMTAHPFMADWFRRVKKRYRNAHVSWAWRGPADQNRMKAEGKSNAEFGKSPHNHMVDDRPCSLALDLFLLDEDGLARFPPMFYAKVNSDNERDREPIKWGGKFKSFGDANHFEMVLA